MDFARNFASFRFEVLSLDRERTFLLSKTSFALRGAAKYKGATLIRDPLYYLELRASKALEI